jgi:hypothetical protein
MSGIRHCRTILFRIFDFVNSKRKCFVFHNLPILPRFGYFSLMSIFTYCLIIIPCWFCKFGLVNSKTKCALRDRILESKISVGVNLFISRSSSTRLNRHHIPRFGCFSLVSILTGDHAWGVLLLSPDKITVRRSQIRYICTRIPPLVVRTDPKSAIHRQGFGHFGGLKSAIFRPYIRRSFRGPGQV